MGGVSLGLSSMKKKEIKIELLDDVIKVVSGWSGPMNYDEFYNLLEQVKEEIQNEDNR